MKPSIAVLPFDNLSGAEGTDFEADGLVDDLITGLSRFRTFAVVSRNSTFVYKGRAVDARQAAVELGVRYLLEGSVRRSGDRVRITAQLIEGATGVHLWAEKLDGELDDIFEFQDRITASVIGLIEPRIQLAEIERARQKRPETLTRGTSMSRQCRSSVSPCAGYDTAIALLTRAIAIEPNYCPALAMASWAHERRRTYGGQRRLAGVDRRRRPPSPSPTSGRGRPQRCAGAGQSGLAAHPVQARLEAASSMCERAVSLNPYNRSVLELCVGRAPVRRRPRQAASSTPSRASISAPARRTISSCRPTLRQRTVHDRPLR